MTRANSPIRKVLMVSPVPSHPQDAGNRARIFGVAEALRSLRCHVHFAYYDMEGGDYAAMRAYWGDRLTVLPCRHGLRTQNPLRGLGRLGSRIARAWQHGPAGVSRTTPAPASVDDWCERSVGERVQALHEREAFQVIWVEYVFLSRVLEIFGPSVLKVIDTHDVFSERHELLREHGLPASWFSTTANEEGRGLGRADVVIAIQEREAAFFRGITKTPVRTIGHLVPDAWQPEPGKQDGHVLFAASDNPINVDAWEHFCTAILPLVAAAVSGLSVRIAGKVCRRIPNHPGCEKLGVVEDLGPWYARSRLAVNPVRVGTGLKIKSLEPLAFGCPVVTTPEGIAGIEAARGCGVLVAANPQEFAAHVIRLCTESETHDAQGTRALQFARRYHRSNVRRLSALVWGTGREA